MRPLTGPTIVVSPDGKALLMLKPAEDETQMIVVSNWLSELRARLKAK